ncbi:MAG TPA: extracellular solute-binding protein [Thermomicrobiales bacterium]|nr:extracellular solute-binding protein [Thermomicrobiales bacterium]
MKSPRNAGSFSRRALLRSSAGAGLALGAYRMGAVPAFAQDDIPREPSSATVDGTIQVLQKQDFHPDHNAFVRAEIEAYCEMNGWDVEVSEVGGQTAGEIAQRLVAGVQAGNAPDLYFDNIQVRLFQDLGIFQDVTDLVTEMEEAYGETTPGMHNAAFFNDSWWGVPWFTRVDGWWARRDMFSEIGVEVDSLTGLDERREAALEVSNPEGEIYGWGITVNRSTDARALVQQVLFNFGSTLQDESGDIVTFDSPESREALEWLKETYTSDTYAPMLPTGWNAWTDTSNNEAFLAGILAMTQNAGTMYAKAQLDGVPFADEIAYMPNPVRRTDDQPVDQLAGVLLHVIEGTQNQEAVHDIVRHLLTEPVQQRIWEISLAYAVPAYRNGWSNEVITGSDNAKRAEGAVWNNNEFTGLRWPGPHSVAVDAVAGSFDQVDMVAEVLQGRSVDEVVQDYHSRWVAVWQDYGLPGE